MKVFKLPDLGEGLAEAKVRNWHVKTGDIIKADQLLVSVETAKAVVDIPSPYEGTIEKLFVSEGQIIQTDSPLVGFVGDEQQTKKDAGTVVGEINEGNHIINEAATGITPQNPDKGSTNATPAARMLAQEKNINLLTITGSGPDNTITVHDIESAMHQRPTPPNDFEPLKGITRVMAQKMEKAHSEVVPVSISDDANCSHWKQDEDVTLKLIDAIVQACKEEPMLNAHFHTESLSRKCFDTIHIGIAMDTSEGLFVPVLKNAEQKKHSTLRNEINAFKEKAEHNAFAPEDLEGATITLSNFGMFAGKYGNPIVMPPTVAIIGVGRLHEEVIPEHHQPVVHPVLPISLTFDHRVVTGGQATRFLKVLLDSLSK